MPKEESRAEAQELVDDIVGWLEYLAGRCVDSRVSRRKLVLQVARKISEEFPAAWYAVPAEKAGGGRSPGG